MLRNLSLSAEYFTGQSNLVQEFYGPCLSVSSRYDRSVGYFRSSVFILIGPEVIKFAKNGGKIRLISSPCLTVDDIDAISAGYKKKEDIVSDAIERDINSLFDCVEVAKNTEALATLIAVGALEVKLVFFPEAQGEYHTKLGVFYDNSGDSVVFKGSVNETWRGWHERGNHETLDVFCSWHVGREELRVKNNQAYFDELWNNQINSLDVIPFSKVAIDKLKTVAKESLDDIHSNEITDYFVIGNQNTNNRATVESSVETKRIPLKHQLKAIAEWHKQGRRGIFEHATGSGKTFTALVALKEHLEFGGVALVLVPDKLLHRQWAEEIKGEIAGVILLKAGDGHNKWKKDRRLYDLTSPIEGMGKRVVLATMQTARTDMFLQSLHQGEHIMVVADEVHEIGSRENSKTLSIESGSRLGLSATPKRYGDAEGTFKIINYFGKIVQPPYTLVDAIKDERLVPYEYFPKTIRLSAEESEKWAKKTDKISKEYARSKRDNDGNAIASPYLQNLIIQRSRIAKKAKAKTPLAVSIVKEHYQQGESWLIYCEDQYQLGEVLNSLKQEGLAPLEYHTNMDGNSEASLDYFKNFGGILCSIKCLDQGVDIPKISHAVILASSQNPRQFIQRRGRVLRVCDDKYKAVIYDAIVVPLSLELEPTQLSLLKSELQRSIQFAKTALNTSAANELINLAIDLNIDPEEVGLMDTDGIEELQGNVNNE
ncbi:MAG: type III restriction endonuclease subunit R [Cycloclasticus sp.]|nr:MAG: type III restriction endonuclease subunit R [Cycloclasticus sp.]